MDSVFVGPNVQKAKILEILAMQGEAAAARLHDPPLKALQSLAPKSVH